MLERAVLLFDPCQVTRYECLGELLERFAIKRVGTADEATRWLAANACHVGLFALDPLTAPYQHETLLSRPGLEWVALASRATLDDRAMQAFIRDYFFDYHTLPIDPQRLVNTLGHAIGKARLAPPMAVSGERRFGLIGKSPPMLALFEKIERIAKVDAPVLIGGETGTGKELVARAIAEHSRRAKGPFVAVNCGAIAPGLIQSELFGHEKGAFTGAASRKIGSVEAAHRGVLLLDEIGDLPLEQQATLLRFLQERVILRLGATTPTPVDVRIIAATHVDLAEAVNQQRFRQDLFYRLNVITLRVPALRERGDDIALLSDALLHTARERHAAPPRAFSRDAKAALHQYRWPGNVRELINRIQRAVIMCEGKLIHPEDLGLATDPPPRARLTDARQHIERETIERTLGQNRNNISQTARSLGVSRVTLYRMMQRLKISSGAGC